MYAEDGRWNKSKVFEHKIDSEVLISLVLQNKSAAVDFYEVLRLQCYFWLCAKSFHINKYSKIGRRKCNLQSVKIAFGVNHKQILFSSFSGFHDGPISDELFLWSKRRQVIRVIKGKQAWKKSNSLDKKKPRLWPQLQNHPFQRWSWHFRLTLPVKQ